MEGDMIWQINGMVKKIKTYETDGGVEINLIHEDACIISTQAYSASSWTFANVKVYLLQL